MNPTTATDAALVALAASGSDHAFRSVYRRYARPVYWIAHGLLSDTADAEDVMQETFVVAWRKLPALELQSDSLLPWLATICRFQASNRIRTRRRDRAHTAEMIDDTVADTVDVEDQVIGDELARLIAAEVETLSPVDREIFRLCAVEGYAYQAAADSLDVSHAVVRNRLSRIRTRLRSSIDGRDI